MSTADTTTAPDRSGSGVRVAAILSFVVIIAVAIIIPASVGGKGWSPFDDALRHTAKALSGRAWDDILVLRDNVKSDGHIGWHAVLGATHRVLGFTKEGMVVFSVTLCFLSFAVAPLFFLKRVVQKSCHSMEMGNWAST